MPARWWYRCGVHAGQAPAHHPRNVGWLRPHDQERGVRAIDLYVRGDAEQLAKLVALVDRGELRVAVAERVPLAELSALHARAAGQQDRLRRRRPPDRAD